MKEFAGVRGFMETIQIQLADERQEVGVLEVAAGYRYSIELKAIMITFNCEKCEDSQR